VNPLAGIGTNILEFGVLTQLTGDPGYYRVAKRAYRAAMQRRCPLAGHGAALNVETGEWAESADPIPPGDSFYEYLWGAWAMFGDRDTLRWYRMCLGGGAEHAYGSWAEIGQSAPAGRIQEAFTRYLRTGGEAHRMAAYQRLQELKASGALLAGPWSATTLKFLYLLFARSPRFDYRRHHISAGGKVLRGLLPARR
jgi:Glycosyl hydrolase family 47